MDSRSIIRSVQETINQNPGTRVIVAGKDVYTALWEACSDDSRYLDPECERIEDYHQTAAFRAGLFSPIIVLGRYTDRKTFAKIRPGDGEFQIAE